MNEPSTNDADTALPESLRATIIDLVKQFPRSEVVRQVNRAFPDLHLTYDQVYRFSKTEPDAVRVDILRKRAVYQGPVEAYQGRFRTDAIMSLYDSGMGQAQIRDYLQIDGKVVNDTVARQASKRRVEQAKQRFAAMRQPLTPMAKRLATKTSHDIAY